MKTITLAANLLHRRLLERALPLIPLLLACFALLRTVEAVSPPPDGGYAGGNTAEGQAALLSLSSGTYNTAVGLYSLLSNTTANFNTALGAGTLLVNTADQNTATGAGALLSNTVGTGNTATGAFALFGNIDGFNNTAVGDRALLNNVDGSDNTAVGDSTGQNVIAGFNNTYIGDFVGFLAADESNTIRIGDLSNGNGAGSLECFIGGIFNNNQPVGGTVVQVTLDLADDWDFGPNQGGSAPVQRGAPVPRSAPQRQAMLNDKVEKLEATVAQLKSTVAKQEATIAQQQRGMDAVTVRLNEQASQIQNVSKQLEASKPAPQVVNNNQ